jgi:hypothetical protein
MTVEIVSELKTNEEQKERKVKTFVFDKIHTNMLKQEITKGGDVCR